MAGFETQCVACGFDMSDGSNQHDEGHAEYRVLARKYRPSSFTDLIGQEPMVRTLSNAFATGRIAQAYMLTGVRGVGKTTTARILARALNFETDEINQPSLDLTSEGVHCRAIMDGNHVDVVEMDAASHTGIGDIREIIASVRYKPVSARYKVYIIDEVHMLSTAAFNGLLKTLEEPPEHVKFIFATTEIRKVPITVLSRCQRFDLRRVDAGELAAHLDKIAKLEKVDCEPEALAMIARAAEGSVRDSLSLLDQAIAHAAGSGGGQVVAGDVRNMLGLADRTRVIDLFEQVMKGDITAALAEIKDQYDSGAEPATVLTDLAEFVHFVTKVRYVDSALDDPALSQEEKTRGQAFAQALSPRILSRTWQMLLKGISEVQSSARPLAAADMVLVRITHAADLPSPEDALKMLDPTRAAQSVGLPQGGAGASQPGAGPSAHQPNMSPVASAPAGADQGSDFATMKVGNGPALVVDNARALEAPGSAEPAAEIAVEPPALRQVFETINTFDDLLSVAEKKRDIKFKLLLRNNYSAVSFESGKIEFCPVGNAPRDMAQIMRTRLREWTGEAWEVIASEQEGQATLKEIEVADHEQKVADAEADPTVAAILKMFPKSKIVDVRFPNADADDGLDLAGAEEAALANPDLEVEDDEATGAGAEAGDPGASGPDDYL